VISGEISWLAANTFPSPLRKKEKIYTSFNAVVYARCSSYRGAGPSGLDVCPLLSVLCHPIKAQPL
jgi:hypothetical protein